MIPTLNLQDLVEYLWPKFEKNGQLTDVSIPKKSGDWSILDCCRHNQYLVLRYDFSENDITILRFYGLWQDGSRAPNCPEIRMSIEVKDKINPIYLYCFKQSEIEQAQKVYDRKIEALTIFLGC